MKSHRAKIAEYRQMQFPMGVFQIRNTASGRVLIDRSINMPALWNRHRFQLELGNHPCQALQADWRAMGEAAFRFEILEELEPDPKEPDRDYRADVEALLELWLGRPDSDQPERYR